jgi:hypothetical protein
VRAKRYVAPLVGLCFLLPATAAHAGPLAGNPKSHCRTLRAAVPTTAPDGTWAGTLLVAGRYCYNGTVVTELDPTTNGRAAPGWTYRGVVHARYFGSVGSPFRGVWEMAQFCHGANELECIGTTDSTFPRVWLVTHGDGAYLLGRGTGP